MDFKKILKIKGLKYWVATAVFAVVERELAEAIVQDSVNNAELKGNLDAIEHYGRENYYMKRADEDIFVIK